MNHYLLSTVHSNLTNNCNICGCFSTNVVQFKWFIVFCAFSPQIYPPYEIYYLLMYTIGCTCHWIYVILAWSIPSHACQQRMVMMTTIYLYNECIHSKAFEQNIIFFLYIVIVIFSSLENQSCGFLWLFYSPI